MKTALTAVLLSVFLAVQAESPEHSRTKVAVVSLQRIVNSGINYEKIRLLSLDKATLEALKKINKETQEVQTQIVDVDDEVKLADLGRRLEFLNRKSMLLRQRPMGPDSSRDLQGMVRKFVIDKFKDKYALIIQQDVGFVDRSGNGDRVVWKSPDVAIDDITDEALEEFQKYVDQAADGTFRPTRPGRHTAH
jgi:hypothetical protein